MALDDVLIIYFSGAILTAVNVTKLTYFYRCVLLWPVFWLYVLTIVARSVIDDIRNK